MKKNNILTMTMALTMALALTSCNLDEYPKDSISPDTFFKTEQELKLYSNQFYTQLPDADSYYKEMSDHIINLLAYNDAFRGYAHVVPGTGGGWSWGALRHINYFLSNINRCTNESVRRKYEGVARFWRAYFYFDKLQRFGEVPCYTQVIGSDDGGLLHQPRNSRDSVIHMIITDLDSATVQLPEVGDNKYYVSKYAALALKSRACLYEGTFRKYHAGDVFNPNSLPYTQLLQQSVEASNAIMTSGKYELYTTGSQPYYDLFVNATSEKEYILARSYGVASHEASAFALSSSKGCAGFTRSLALSYLMKDGTYFSKQPNYDKKPFYEEYLNRDPRMAQTILTKGFVYKDGASAVYKKELSVSGYPVVKFVEGPSMIKGSHMDLPIYRLAEIYLNYAEALAELGTLTQGDLDKSINLLRDRVQMAHLNLANANENPDPVMMDERYGYKNVSGTNKGVILEIRRERSIELVMEGVRYQDLVRWRELTRLDNQHLDGTSNGYEFVGPYVPGKGRYDMDGDGNIDLVVNPETGRGFPTPAGVTAVQINKDIFLTEGTKGYIIALQDMARRHDETRDYLYPIPTTELILSNGSLKQNPNWDDIDR